MIAIRRSTLAAALVAAALFVAYAAPARAQVVYNDLTEVSAAGLVAFHNAPTTLRLAGEAYVPGSGELGGDVAILNGPLVVEGVVSGNVIVINGSAILVPGARVTGDITVVGGDIDGVESAYIDGTLAVFREPLRYRRADDLIELQGPEPIAGLRAGRDFGFGNTSFSVAMRGAYNRVEGLPIAFGPRVEFGRSNPTVVDASLIYRTAGGFTLEEDQIGHVVRVEQYLGGHGRFRLGVSHRSEVLPIELMGLTDTEASLATFVLHRDYRDHYERRGWSAYLRWTNERRALDATLEYRNEEHDTRAAQSPWTLFDNGEAFRFQPLVADGDLESLVLSVEHDSRNDTRDPSAGWWIRFESDQGLGGDLAASFGPDGDGGVVVGPVAADSRYTALTLDARRYLRFGPLTRASVRLWAAGSVDGGALPAQRQHALGGEGTMPGFDLYAFDCGARRTAVTDEDDLFFLYYGCDRALLGQAMVERTLPFIRPLGRSLGLNFDFGHEPALALFVDVGRAWIEDGALRSRETGESSFAVDGGLGIRLGRVGLYWALPISDDGGPNFFVRIGPRI